VRGGYLPGGGGQVVITSRNPGWHDLATPVGVDVFDRDESITLLSRRAPQLTDEQAGRVAEALGDLPLALAQAAALLADTATSVVDYLTLESVNNLGFDLFALGHYEQSRRLGEDTHTRYRRVLGDDHPDTLNSAGHLTACLRELGQYEQARQLAEDTYARSCMARGDDHPDTLRLATHLGAVLRALRQYEAARQLDEDTLICRRRVLGDDHPTLWNRPPTLRPPCGNSARTSRRVNWRNGFGLVVGTDVTGCSRCPRR
jgi:Tetratricopeptide repeat